MKKVWRVKRKELFATLLIVLFVALSLPVMVKAEGATIWTDKGDYSPGETVTIYGSGFNPEAPVNITVTRPDSTMDEWAVTSDSSGSFTTTYLLNGITGTYTVTATDGTNTATTTFIDSTITIRVNRDTPTAASFNTASESTFSVKFRVDNDNTAGDAGRTISGTYTLTFSVLSLVSGPSSSGTFSALAKVSPIYYEWTFKAPVGPATGSITLSVAITSVSPSRDFGPGDKTSDSISYTVNVLAPPTVSITVTSSPTGSGFVKVDGSAITTPTTFSWTPGDTHTLEALSPVAGSAGTQYVWTSWSDGGAQTHNYVVPSSSATVTANYQTQYYITVTSAHGSPTQSSQWVNAGSDFSVSVTTPDVVVADEHRWVLTGLTVDGAPQTVSDTVSFTNVQAAHSIVFSWTEQWYITVTSPHGSPTQASQWVNDGDPFSVSVTTPDVVVADEHRWLLTGLTVDGTPQSLSDTVSYAAVHASHTIVFSWTEQWYITVTSAHGSPYTASDWVNAGADFTASVTSPDYVDATHRWVCTGYSIDGGAATAGTSYTFTAVDASHTIVFNWQEQYKLTLATDPSGVGVSNIAASPASGDGFYDVNTVVQLTATTPVAIDSTSRYRFDHWSGDATGSANPTSVTMTSAKSVTANYIVQYKLTVASDHDSPDPTVGDHWYDTGTHVDASVTTPADESDGTRYRCTGWSGTGSVPSSGSASSFDFDITAPSSITWNWIAQYKLTFAQTGLDSDATGTVVTIGGVAKTFTDLPITDVWYDSGTTYSYEDIVSGGSGKRFVKTSVTGPSSPISTSGTVTGNYHTEYYVTFDQTGLTDATGTVVTIGGSAKTKDDLPLTDWFDSGTTYSYEDVVASLTAGKRFKLIDVTGPTSPIGESGTVSGNYKTQYEVTFDQTGLDGTASGTVVTIGGDAKEYGDLPFTDWFDSGTSYSYEDIVASSESGKRFKLINVDGPESPIATSGTVTGNYKTQYQITVTASPPEAIGGTFKVTYTQCGTTYTDELHTTPWTDWADAGTDVSVSDPQSPIVVGDTRYVFQSYSPAATVSMSEAKTITLNYKTQYKVSFTQTGSAVAPTVTYTADIDPTDTVPFSVWVKAGSEISYTYQDPVYDPTPGIRYKLVSVSPASPQTVTGPLTILGTYKTQYYLTVTDNIGGLSDVSTQSGWHDECIYVTLTAPAIVPVSTGVQYRFDEWDVTFPIHMDAPKTATANYIKQYYLTLATDPSGVTTPSGEGWYDEGATADISTNEFVDIVTDESRYRFDGWTTTDMDEIDDASATSTTVLMDKAKTVTANYVTQYYVTFAQTGLDSSATGTVVTVDGDAKEYGDLPFSMWVDDGDTVSYAYADPVSSSTPGKQFRLDSVTGPTSPITVSGKTDVTGNYVVQYLVTFTQTGLDGTATGTVVTVDGSAKTYGDLPFSKWVDKDTTVSYSHETIVSSSDAGKRFRLDSVDGPSSPIAVTDSVTVTGNYVIQYYLTVNTDPAEVLTLDPSAVSGEDWYDSGTTANVDAVQLVDKVAGESRYDFRSWTGATPTGVGNQAEVVMDGPKTATANYQLQYKITFDQTGVGTDFTGTVVTIDGADYVVTDLPKEFWWDENSGHTFSFASPLVVNGGKRYVWTSTTGLSNLQSDTLTITTSGSVTGNYKTQWLQTFTSSGLGSDATGTLVTVTISDGEPSGPHTITVPSGTLWVDDGATVTYSYQNPVSSSTPSWQYWLSSVTGPSSPYTVSQANTVIGNYVGLPLSQVTTSKLCYFDVNAIIDGQQFRLIFTQDPTNPSTYKLTASNPGQFYYNVFYIGTPGTTVTLTITIPYPFVTQGAVPIHVYSRVDIVGGCFVPSGEISSGTSFTITVAVPGSGLVYVTVHLDYDLKKTVGYTPDTEKNAEKPPGTDVIVNHASYAFSYAVDSALIATQTIENENVFKRDPGFGGLVTDSTGTPVKGVKVQIFGPDGKLLATVYTDEDGWYQYNYKHTGKAATFTIKLPDYGQQQSVTLKANSFALVNFQIP